MEITFTTDGLIGVAIVFGFIVFVYLIVREIRLMKTNNRRLELELEREKIGVLRQDTIIKGPSLIQLSGEQLNSLREIDEMNETLDKNLFVNEKLVQNRIQKLEKLVKNEKLERMLTKIQEEEKKIV